MTFQKFRSCWPERLLSCIHSCITGTFGGETALVRAGPSFLYLQNPPSCGTSLGRSAMWEDFGSTSVLNLEPGVDGILYIFSEFIFISNLKYCTKIELRTLVYFYLNLYLFTFSSIYFFLGTYILCRSFFKTI